MKIRILFVILLIFGCDKSNITSVKNVSNGIKISLSKSIYNINESIIFDISNQSNLTAYLYLCSGKFFPISIEQEINGNWFNYLKSACFSTEKSGIGVLKKGEESKATVVVKEFGVYRLKFFYSFTKKDTLDKLLYSSSFTVK